MKLKVTQIRSTIGRKEDQKRTIAALGLGKINRARIHDDNPVIRGMVNKVSHLIKVEKVEEKVTKKTISAKPVSAQKKIEPEVKPKKVIEKKSTVKKVKKAVPKAELKKEVKKTVSPKAKKAVTMAKKEIVKKVIKPKKEVIKKQVSPKTATKKAAPKKTTAKKTEEKKKQG